MFRFFIRRYLSKLSALRGLFIFALLPAVVYLVAAASQPDRFRIYQTIKIAPEAPLALSGSPSDFAPVDWFLVHQDELFLDAYALQTLGRELQKELPPQTAIPADARLLHAVKQTMSLSYKNDMLRIMYQGGKRELGKSLTAFYASKVMKKADDGMRRQNMLLALEAQQEGRDATFAPAGGQQHSPLTGRPTVESERAVWRSGRLGPSLLLLAAGALVVCIWIGLLEVLDTSFKSERQVARFLRLPVLGSVPDLRRISKVMSIKI